MEGPGRESFRRPIWLALSDLFLDTEVRGYLPGVAETAHRLGLSSEGLWDILEREVAPLLAPNLLSVAGEWAGFDPAWLFEQLEASNSPAPFPGMAGFLSLYCAPLKAPLTTLLHYLEGHPDPPAEAFRLSILARLFLEKDWAGFSGLWGNIKLLNFWSLPVLEESFRVGFVPAYSSLLRPDEGDPTIEEVLANWGWYELLRSRLRDSKDEFQAACVCEELSFLFRFENLVELPRGAMVREALLSSGLSKEVLCELLRPLARLYPELQRAEDNLHDLIP